MKYDVIILHLYSKSYYEMEIGVGLKYLLLCTLFHYILE